MIALVVVLAAVVFVAAGRGGGMPATERTDYAPLEMGPVSATDIVLLRPPTALWGYSQQATDEALERIAESVRERDVRIVALEQLVTDLSQEPSAAVPLGSPYGRARHARPGLSTDTIAEERADTWDPAGTGLTGTVPNPIQHAAFGPRPYAMGAPAPEQPEQPEQPEPQDVPGDTPGPAATPLGAPVADQDAWSPPLEAGADGPPEVSHD